MRASWSPEKQEHKPPQLNFSTSQEPSQTCCSRWWGTFHLFFLLLNGDLHSSRSRGVACFHRRLYLPPHEVAPIKYPNPRAHNKHHAQVRLLFSTRGPSAHALFTVGTGMEDEGTGGGKRQKRKKKRAEWACAQRGDQTCSKVFRWSRWAEAHPQRWLQVGFLLKQIIWTLWYNRSLIWLSAPSVQIQRVNSDVCDHVPFRQLSEHRKPLSHCVVIVRRHARENVSLPAVSWELDHGKTQKKKSSTLQQNPEISRNKKCGVTSWRDAASCNCLYQTNNTLGTG